MHFDLPNWNKLGDVQWGDHPLIVFEKDNSLLMLLAEKRGDRTIGFACSACKPFKVKGDASKLDLVHFSTDLTLLKKLNASDSFTYLLAFTKPTYIAFSEASISTSAQSHAKQLQELHYDVKNVCKGVTLLETSKDDAKLLVTPELLFSMLSHLRSSAKQKGMESLLGVDLKGEKVLASVSSTSLGLVVGGDKAKRLHVLHLLCEEVLQQNSVVVVFDSSNKFNGLAHPSALKLNEFMSFGLAGLPAGFPMRELTPGKNAFVPVSSFSPSSILSPFGLNDHELTTYLSSSIQSNFENVENQELKQFTELKLNRILKLLSHSMQGVFGSGANFLDVSYSLGKVLHVDLSQCSQEASAFFCIGLLKELEKTQRPVFLLFEQDANEVKSLVKLAVDKFLGSNVSILCHADHENDVPFVKSADLFIEIIDKDVAITQGGKPPLRVKLRPTYSACTEL